MCGIAGLWATDGVDVGARVVQMTACLVHRGPDGDGLWSDPAAGIALGHRRLAIVDLSPEGRQPMVSTSGRYVLSFNGEIYNFRDLRRQLEASGSQFRGSSDTEVALEAIEQWGVEKAVANFAGMFAIALWDRADRELLLVRDRFGKKPLYLGCIDGALTFASELKSLMAVSSGRLGIDRVALHGFLRTGYVSGPRSILDGVERLSPGHLARIRRTPSGALEIRRAPFWSAQQVVVRAASSPFRGTLREAEDELARILRVAVRERMVADVPLGAFLSGGIDSSLVVAMMQAEASDSLRTFCAGFDDREIDESDSANAIAGHLGTTHVTLPISSAAMLADVPKLAAIYDEPFADSSQVATYLIAKLARQHVTVAVTGDGGDEIFSGYNRYTWWRRVDPYLRVLPASLRRMLATRMGAMSPTTLSAFVGVIQAAVPRRWRPRNAVSAVRKATIALKAFDPAGYYHDLTTQWPDMSMALLEGPADAPAEPPLGRWPASGDDAIIERMMLEDLTGYLPDDVLVKVDRATMAASLEARSPLLDHRVFEFAASLPLQYKAQDGVGKSILRTLLARYVPRPLFERPKAGFAVPIAAWLRGPLRSWADDLLSERSLASWGLVDPAKVAFAWSQFRRGATDEPYGLWNVVMLQAWLQAWPVSRSADSRFGDV